MAHQLVDSYQINLDFKGGQHAVTLYQDDRQVGRIVVADNLPFLRELVDLMRDVPPVYWDDGTKQLHLGFAMPDANAEGAPNHVEPNA